MNNIDSPKNSNERTPIDREIYNVIRSPNKPIVTNGSVAARISEQIVGSEFLANIVIVHKAIFQTSTGSYIPLLRIQRIAILFLQM